MNEKIVDQAMDALGGRKLTDAQAHRVIWEYRHGVPIGYAIERCIGTAPRKFHVEHSASVGT